MISKPRVSAAGKGEIAGMAGTNCDFAGNAEFDFEIAGSARYRRPNPTNATCRSRSLTERGLVAGSGRVIFRSRNEVRSRDHQNSAALVAFDIEPAGSVPGETPFSRDPRCIALGMQPEVEYEISEKSQKPIPRTRNREARRRCPSPRGSTLINHQSRTRRRAEARAAKLLLNLELVSSHR